MEGGHPRLEVLQGGCDVSDVGFSGIMEQGVEGYLGVLCLLPADAAHQQRVLCHRPRPAGVPRKPVCQGQGVGDIPEINVLSLRRAERKLPSALRYDVWSLVHVVFSCR